MVVTKGCRHVARDMSLWLPKLRVLGVRLGDLLTEAFKLLLLPKELVRSQPLLLVRLSTCCLWIASLCKCLSLVRLTKTK